jgi:hypothetical protein
MHNGGPFEVGGNVARRLVERRNGLADLLTAPGHEARVAVVGVSFLGCTIENQDVDLLRRCIVFCAAGCANDGLFPVIFRAGYISLGGIE